MCVAVPMRIVRLDRDTASCETKGVRRMFSLSLLGTPGRGGRGSVLIRVGYAPRDGFGGRGRRDIGSARQTLP
jgi:hydrogenase assembly chaperone HypC/HupF